MAKIRTILSVIVANVCQQCGATNPPGRISCIRCERPGLSA
jgi:ribosomal protein L40E